MSHADNKPPAVIVDTSHSAHARLRPVPLTDVALTDGFWGPRLQTNRELTLPSQYRFCEETGRIDNFRRAAGKIDTAFKGFCFNDSDVYKWLEAAAWVLAAEDDPSLAGMLDAVITEIAGAQQTDGYINTYYTFDREAERWSNLRDMHELYCAGHLFQAAVAHYRATGSDRLLNIARRFADHIDARFGLEDEGKQPGTGGHPEIEMGLFELARTCDEPRYRDLAQFFIDLRGRGLIGGKGYHQDHRPFREMDRVTGHAVRAVYLNAGAADLYAETGETALYDALVRTWDNMTACQMYVSGGIGGRYQGEAFGKDYELPNARAYAETCAAIANVMWNWRMLALDGDARYADVMEVALYNGFLSGVSLDGASYFYPNPLADDGSRRRVAWFECACCPVNIARTLAALPGYFYSISSDELDESDEVAGVWVHLYAEGSLRATLPGGRSLGLTQFTKYPWQGEVSIEVEGEGEFSLYLRVPAWCEGGATLEVNGEPFGGALMPGTYAEVRRAWHTGDVVCLNLPMSMRLVAAHPYVMENTGRVAVMRGPLLYCAEGVDNPGVDLRDLRLPVDAVFETVFDGHLLGGVDVLHCRAEATPPGDGWAGRLYRTVSGAEATRSCPVELTLVPYYAWANRAPGPMQVWLRVQDF